MRSFVKKAMKTSSGKPLEKPPGNPPDKPQAGVIEMAKPEDGSFERNVPMEIVIKVGEELISHRKFLLYPGTEVIYGQGVDAAVAQALGTISKAAYILVKDAEGAPASMVLEAAFGSAVQSAQK
jgi:hypothetical protein